MMTIFLFKIDSLLLSYTVVKVAVASSVFAFFLASIVFFIIGILCGRFSKRKEPHAPSNEPVYSEPSSLYNTVTVFENEVPRCQERDIELNDNVAYAPVKSAV